MSGVLLDQTFAGATTCIVVGGLDGVAPRDFSHYRSLLWFVDSAAALHPPAGLARDRLKIASIEQLAAADLASALERFVRLNPRSLPSLLVTAAVAGPHADRYQAVIDEVHRHLESTQRARVTRQKDGFAWQRHILQNAPAYIRHRVPDAWAGALRGLPAFVVGAGPSLDVSIEKLAAHAGRAVIFSADSALRALARRGVAADFAVSTDAAKVPEKCLPDDLAPARVVLASVSPPSWSAALPADHSFFLSGNQLTDDWLATHGVARTAITVAESCGSTALELAHFLGCDPICLFGLDLAVDPANQARRHQQDADPALYVKSNYDPTVALPRVPGNYAETVPSFALGDWRDLDARLAARTTPQILNVNDRGARLRGTTLVHPNAFALRTPTREKSAALVALSAAASPGSSADFALGKLRAVGTRCTQAIPNLRRALERGGPVALAAAFPPLVLDPEIGRALGAFALKLMPHLVPPIEGDAAFWQSLLDEFTELTALTKNAGRGG
jgi:hypothetical protein